jgi:transposase
MLLRYHGYIPSICEACSDRDTQIVDDPKMGQRDIRTLLISGAMAVLQAVERFGTPNNGWLTPMRARKPRMVVAIALANKMVRGLWAMMTKQEDYRNTVATMA